MNGSRSNAFLDQGFNIGGHPRDSLASMLAAMRASLETTAQGYRLSLTPMRFIDAMGRWFDINSRHLRLGLQHEFDSLSAPNIPKNEIVGLMTLGISF